MGASYSFVCCSVLGGAMSYPDNETPFVTPFFEGRSYMEKLKLFGALLAIGMIFFFVFYSHCHWSLDYCGFLGVSSNKDWTMAILSGFLLGFGIVGLVFALLRRSPDDIMSYGYGGSYNPMITTQPAISMI